MTYNFSSFDTDLQGAVEWLRKEYTQISTGRANPALLDSIQVESYGSYQPIKNVAAISIEEARTLRISPWDKSQVKDIEKAIRESGLPFSVSVDDQGLRASIPQLTTENKQQVVKILKQKLEEARVHVRQARQKTEKEIDAEQKSGDLSEDEARRDKDAMQKKVDNANSELDALFSKKETDVLNV